jgi:hypothetical protein
MDKGKEKKNGYPIILSICVIITALIGLLYKDSGASFEVQNMYGDTVQLYGNGIYAYNSVLNVANYMGTNVTELIGASLLIILTLWKNRPLWAEVLRTSEIISLLYASMTSVFGISMNQLYLLYVMCFGIGLITAFISVKNLFDIIEVPEEIVNTSKFKGTGYFLIISGVITALVWISSIMPVVINGEFGSLLGVQTSEATFGIDLGIVCPLFIYCGISVLRKKIIGYKIAPLLLNMLVGVAILVTMQRFFCIKLGIEIPPQVLVIFILSFILLGTLALYFLIRLLVKLKRA